MKREDGRAVDEYRPLEIKVGIIPNANGSAMVKMGKTVAIAGVYGPVEFLPKHKQLSDRAVLRCIYTMAPFSTEDRVRPGPSRRSTEISMVTANALSPVVFLEEFPTSVINVFINIIQANAGTRTAGINAASVALADAGIPMRDLVASIAAGKIGDEYVLDLAGKEEEATKADIPIAYSPRAKQITLLQMDGDLPPADVKKVIELNIKACEKIYETQKTALKERWKK
ncbi:MAG: exosome complex exonuclease Rrp41 [Candidatus Aenigmarchaeota archaeon]|nr:exosome complex exonuclease Rrp41 [Candidatus Aenigmarchaeota archaeon]